MIRKRRVLEHRLTIGARVLPNVRDAIAEVAKTQKKTPSQVIEHALIAWLAMQQEPQKAA